MLTSLCRLEFAEETHKIAFSMLKDLDLKEKTIGVAMVWCVLSSTCSGGRGVEARGSMMRVERMDLGVSPFIEYLLEFKLNAKHFPCVSSFIPHRSPRK